MARSQRKARGVKRGSFKRKRMGKGWSTVRRMPSGTRPVLRITEPEAGAAAAAEPAGAQPTGTEPTGAEPTGTGATQD